MEEINNCEPRTALTNISINIVLIQYFFQAKYCRDFSGTVFQFLRCFCVITMFLRHYDVPASSRLLFCQFAFFELFIKSICNRTVTGSDFMFLISLINLTTHSDCTHKRSILLRLCAFLIK